MIALPTRIITYDLAVATWYRNLMDARSPVGTNLVRQRDGYRQEVLASQIALRAAVRKTATAKAATQEKGLLRVADSLAQFWRKAASGSFPIIGPSSTSAFTETGRL